MSTTGRPRSLDETKRREVVALISVGLGLQDAARYVGCSVSTLRREMQRNADFRQDVRSAEIRSQIDALRAMRAASATHWRAAAWFLERANPRRFARPSLRAFNSDEIQTVLDDVITAAVDEIDDVEVRQRVVRRLAMAGNLAARALDTDAAHRLDAVLPARKTAGEREIDAVLKEIDDRSEESRRILRRGAA
ncbi:helix-turn-helix domain-containing protein [Lacipirellula sp.]|uniref:helix-turn-helix domain-containing protein n=1 Tax=Lacipirellula sp. TaxID=2691419 RepID=UPI003D113C70